MFQSGRQKNNLPISIFLTAIFIALLGLVAIYDASVIDAFKTFNDKYHYVKQQSLWIIIGAVVCWITTLVPLEIIKKNAHIIYGVSLFFMFLVLIPGIGSRLLGARRWIHLGPVGFQPSELLKISFAIYLSKWLDKPRDIKQFLLLLSINLGLIMLQPDLGTAIIVVGTAFMIYYLSGAPIKEILIFSGILGLAVSLLILVSPYRMNRLKTFVDPTVDPLGASYHINQILYGLGSGGVSGVGLGRSRQKYAFLPEATTDSIFVIIAEEFGFIGGTFFILVLMALLMESFRVSQNVSDKFDKLLASGISLLFLLQIFVNLSSMVALVPLTGVPLPLISYGGSSLVTNFIAIGLLINIAKKT